jgi:predicted chitinase
MEANVVDSLTISDIRALFPARAAGNVKQHWPEIQRAIKTAGLSSDSVVISYILTTIRAETGTFTLTDERSSPLSTSADGRPFGVYDKVALTADGKPRIRVVDGHLKLISSSSGNKPHIGGTWLDPNVSGENQWRSLKGMEPREVVESNDGENFKGRGYVQLTGRANYTAADRELHLGLVEHPERAGEPAIAARILIWYIAKRQNKIRHHLGGMSPNYLEARALVNGKNADGTVNGLDDFETAYDLAMALLAAKEKTKDKKSAGPVRVPPLG